jgi:hypothetical protein
MLFFRFILRFIKLGPNNRLLFAIGNSFVLAVVLMMLFVKTPTDNPTSLFGDLTVKEQKNKSETQNVPSQHTLRYRERKSVEHPFLSFSREDSSAKSNQEDAPEELSAPTDNERKGFFTVINSDRKQEAHFFEAIFEESQRVKDGKALNIVLKDPIPSLGLAENTILKGIPYLEGGTRLKIKITAAIVGDTVIPISLHCFDKADCREGLYHEDLAEQLEGTRGGQLLETVLDLYTGEGKEVIRQGKNLVRKFSDLLKVYESGIVIAKGRELFVAFPEDE